MKIGLACEEGNDLGFYLEKHYDDVALRVKSKAHGFDYYILSITPQGCLKLHSGISHTTGLKMENGSSLSKIKLVNE